MRECAKPPPMKAVGGGFSRSAMYQVAWYYYREIKTPFVQTRSSLAVKAPQAQASLLLSNPYNSNSFHGLSHTSTRIATLFTNICSGFTEIKRNFNFLRNFHVKHRTITNVLLVKIFAHDNVFEDNLNPVTFSTHMFVIICKNNISYIKVGSFYKILSV